MVARQPTASGTAAVADLAPLADQAHAERALVAQAGLGHLDVALLEHLERQHAVREEDGVQREI